MDFSSIGTPIGRNLLAWMSTSPHCDPDFPNRPSSFRTKIFQDIVLLIFSNCLTVVPKDMRSIFHHRGVPSSPVSLVLHLMFPWVLPTQGTRKVSGPESNTHARNYNQSRSKHHHVTTKWHHNTQNMSLPRTYVLSYAPCCSPIMEGRHTCK